MLEEEFLKADISVFFRRHSKHFIILLLSFLDFGIKKVWSDVARDCCWKLLLVLGFSPSSSHRGQKTDGDSFFFQAAGNLALAMEVLLSHSSPKHSVLAFRAD